MRSTASGNLAPDNLGKLDRITISMLKEKALQYPRDRFVRMLTAPVLVGMGIFPGFFAIDGSGNTLRFRSQQSGKKIAFADLVFLLNPHVGLAAHKVICAIGSDTNNDIIIEDKTISKTHATITVEDDECFIFDNSSKNGTYINNIELNFREVAQLNDGDEVRFGRFSFVFLLPQTLYKKLTKNTLPKNLEEINNAGRLEYASLKSFASLNDQAAFCDFLKRPVLAGAALYRYKLLKNMKNSDSNKETLEFAVPDYLADNEGTLNLRKPLPADPGLWSKMSVLEKTIYCLFDKTIDRLGDIHSRVAIGRVARNDIVMLDDSLSRSHAEIRITSSGYLIHDCHSTNGTAVNKKNCATAGELPVHPGDMVQLGRIQLIFMAPETLYKKLTTHPDP